MACATARNGHCSTPSTDLAASRRPCEMAISVAPPPGRSFGSNTTLRATPMASCKLRSISLSTSLEPPRSRMVQAVGSLHSSRKLKYSSPYLRTSNRPQAVPMSSSVISSGRLTMVAPVTRAIRLLSLLRTRRSAVTPALTKKCWAKSETPFSVMTISGLNRRMSVHMRSIASSSWRRIFSQSSSLVISKLVWLSPFLYSSGQSMSSTRGFSMRRRIRECTTSLLSMTPSRTRHSLSSPPGSFSTRA
mmetsp:Transcript_62242/g.126486  ORF Transcript_62242/g.126486 Transcript_62242/m.126486 type:complete len:247 (+) Transcript_62242:425-1165(+)